jgi:hypothetical protein
VNDGVVGQWDLAAARPFDAQGNPVIYIPSFKVTTEGGKAKKIEAKFFFFDQSTKAFREVTDTKGLMSVVHSIGFDVSYDGAGDPGDQHMSTDSSEKSASFENGIVSAELPEELQGLYGCEDASGALCVSKIGMSYHIGPVSYRLELTKNSWLGSGGN